jgi:hypothetical protein
MTAVPPPFTIAVLTQAGGGAMPVSDMTAELENVDVLDTDDESNIVRGLD